MALIKTGTFALLHFSIAFSVVYIMTGDVFIGGAVALVEPACNTVAFFIHEQLWKRHSVGGPRDTPLRAWQVVLPNPTPVRTKTPTQC